MQRSAYLRAVVPVAALLLAGACTPEQELVIEGDVRVTSAGDLDKIRDCTRITGSLKVKRADVERLTLARLEEIGGRLSVQKNEKLREVALPALRRAGAATGHEVIVERNFALETLDLGKLVRAADGLIIRHNPKLSRIALTELSAVGRFGVEVASNDGVVTLALPALAATPRLHVESCYRLEKLGIPVLGRVGALRIKANPSLRSIGEIPADGAGRPADAPRGEAPAGKDIVFEVRDNFALATCEATRLAERLGERGWSGPVTICGNLTDTCEPIGCEADDNVAK